MIDISNVWHPLSTHTLSATTSSGSTLTSAFKTQIQSVMVTATAACFVQFDTAPNYGSGYSQNIINSISKNKKLIVNTKFGQKGEGGSRSPILYDVIFVQPLRALNF